MNKSLQLSSIDAYKKMLQTSVLVNSNHHLKPRTSANPSTTSSPLTMHSPIIILKDPSKNSEHHPGYSGENSIQLPFPDKKK